MRVQTAIVEEAGVEKRTESQGNIQVEEIELGEPKEHEVLVDVHATGVCHSDYHVCTDDAPMGSYPCALGHEGAGIVEQVGDGVSHVEEGDHVVMAYVPGCGKCERCAQGLQGLCVRGRFLNDGPLMEGTYRMHYEGEGVTQFCLLGAYSEKTVVHEDSVVPISDDIPFEVACLTACGVATGFGAAANRASIEAGDTVVHYGFGGVGANAVQGSVTRGADQIIVVDPVEQKREWAQDFGATHVVDPNEEDPVDVVRDLTHGMMADTTILTPDVIFPETVGEALGTVGARGEVVMVAVSPHDASHIDMGDDRLGSILGMEKELKGTVYGGWAPNYAIPRLLQMYQNDNLQLEEIITNRYSLDDINDAFDDMLQGRNIRGVITY